MWTKRNKKCKIIEEFMKMKVPSGRCLKLLETGSLCFNCPKKLQISWNCNFLENIYTMMNFQIKIKNCLITHHALLLVSLTRQDIVQIKLKFVPVWLRVDVISFFAYDSQHKLISVETKNMLHHQVHTKKRVICSSKKWKMGKVY